MCTSSLVPQDADGLRRTFGDLHRRFWQGRFASAAMDEAHLVAAFRYVALNPVRARLARRATDWPWSSSRALCEGVDDGVVTVAPVLDRVGDFAAFLDEAFDEAFTYAAIRKAERIGRPIGLAQWLDGGEDVACCQIGGHRDKTIGIHIVIFNEL